MNRGQLRSDIILAEGNIPYAYQDHLGIWTAGVGFNIDKNHGGSIPDKVIQYWLDYKLDDVEKQVTKELPWIVSRPEPVQRAMMEMAYEMGLGGLLKFNKTLACLQAGDYEGARTHGLDSDWARDPKTAERAKRVTDMFTHE